MQSGRAKFKTAGKGLAVGHVPPGVKPGIVRAGPEIADEQLLGGIDGRNPAVFFFDDVRDYGGGGIVL